MVLKLLVGAEEKLVRELTGEMDAEVVDLRRKDVAYREVLEKIFEADSIQVW
ncbi:MAG TPA: hypothetical protein VJ063_11275 [Verrucomicrobiae bacterium]|nr:hypothetical protein [Verrucomicrobiae bacterium]